MAQQTAVEWFYDILTSENWEYKTYEEQDEIYQKAKQMEKEQMIDLIRFLRTQDKMGKSVEDLYEQYKNK